MLHRLEVQTQYLSHENLASYYVGTPDPLLNDPIIGQRLLIQWCFPRKFDRCDLQLHLKLRLRNHEEKELIRPITENRGYYLYDLVNQAYCESGGILTYKVEIRKGPCILETWKHPLWVDLITFTLDQDINN